MSYQELADGPFAEWNISKYMIARALAKLGYSRCIARSKPPHSIENRRIRKRWAEEHQYWTYDDWKLVLWSDETWVTGGLPGRTWVTRKPNEELEDDCIVDSGRKGNGWMFWGSFSGDTKGPSLFWEKVWGTMTGERYCEKIITLVYGWTAKCPSLKFMQDNAPCHSARSTIRELQDRGIQTISWPPFSPDLNPIESVWYKMKKYIKTKYPDSDRGKRISPKKLREVVEEAWQSILDEDLRRLVESMPARFQAVIRANGGHTKY